MQLSVWETETFFDTQDVIIVGSGLVGLWTALELKQRRPALRITILERGIIPVGASTRNAGFACFGSPSELLYDCKVSGEANMWSLVEMRYRGMQKIQQHFAGNRIDFSLCGGYEVFDADHSHERELNEALHWLNKGLHNITGMHDCFKWAPEKLKAFGFAGFTTMICNKTEGYLHSGKLVQALWQQVQALGVQVFTGVEVVGWEKSVSGVQVHTTNGFNFQSAQLIICTNAFTRALLPDVEVVPARGQVLLTGPVSQLPFRGAFHYDEGFYYFRNLGDRVLIGGARNKAIDAEATTDMITTPQIQGHLEQLLSNRILPHKTFTIEQRWSGIMGFTGKKEPLLKKVSDSVTVALSCNGMGVALSPVIAEKVCEMVL